MLPVRHKVGGRPKHPYPLLNVVIPTSQSPKSVVYFGADGSVDDLKVGVRLFDEPEGVCERWNRIAINSFNLVG